MQDILLDEQPFLFLAGPVETADESLNPDGGGGGGDSDCCGRVGVVDPEGVESAPPGTVYLNTANNGFWIKGSGSGDTGWVPIFI